VQYTKIHVKPLKKLWEDFDVKQRASRIEMEKRGGEISSTSFSSWLPTFYDETLLYLEQEWKWYVNGILILFFLFCVHNTCACTLVEQKLGFGSNL
jgi:hypothetical protein